INVMSQELIQYRQPMEEDELDFLIKKEKKDSTSFFKVVRYCMITSFAVPFVLAWLKAFAGAENPFSILHYFVGTAFLLAFSGSILYMSYYYTLRKVQADVRDKTKTIEY